jgi:hypothetical protein
MSTPERPGSHQYPINIVAGHTALSGDWTIVVYLYALIPNALLVLDR